MRVRLSLLSSSLLGVVCCEGGGSDRAGGLTRSSRDAGLDDGKTGKTEATKLFLAYLAEISSRGEEASQGSIQQQVLEVSLQRGLEGGDGARTDALNFSSFDGDDDDVMFIVLRIE